MLHINIINYKKAYSFFPKFPQNFQKNYRIFTKFSKNFQKKLQEISEKITIKPIYCKYTHKKFVNLQNLRAPSISNTKPLYRLLSVFLDY